MACASCSKGMGRLYGRRTLSGDFDLTPPTDPFASASSGAAPTGVFGPSIQDAFGAGATENAQGQIVDSSGNVVAGGSFAGSTVPTTSTGDSGTPSWLNSLLGGVGQGAGSASVGLLSRLTGALGIGQTAPTQQGSILTSTPFLIGGGVLLFLLLRRKKSQAPA